MARIESGSAFEVFAAEYRIDLRPCLVLLTLGNESMFVPLKLYFVSFTLSRFTMGVGAFSCKQRFILINMSWIRLVSLVWYANQSNLTVYRKSFFVLLYKSKRTFIYSLQFLGASGSTMVPYLATAIKMR